MNPSTPNTPEPNRYCQRCKTQQPADTFSVHGYCARCAAVLEDSRRRWRRRKALKFGEIKRLARLDKAQKNLLERDR